MCNINKHDKVQTSNISPAWIQRCGGPCEHISFYIVLYSEDKIETHHIDDMRSYTL